MEPASGSLGRNKFLISRRFEQSRRERGGRAGANSASQRPRGGHSESASQRVSKSAGQRGSESASQQVSGASITCFAGGWSRWETKTIVRRGRVIFGRGRARFISGEGAQAAAELLGISVGDELLDLAVGSLPLWNCMGKQGFPFGCELENATAAVGRVLGDLDQAAALQGLQCGGQGGAIHGEQRGDGAHGRGLGAVKGHQERELAVGEAEGTEDFVEAAGEGAGGPLDVKAETAVPDKQSCFVRERFLT